MKQKNNNYFIYFIIISFLICVLLIVGGRFSFIDEWTYKQIEEYMFPGLTTFMMFITYSGSSYAIGTFCIGMFLLPKTRKYLAFPISITVVVSTVSNILLKLVFVRERPNILRLIHESDYSFPSGHAMTNMAFYTMLVLLTWKYIKHKGYRYIISIICFIMPLLIGLSRIYLGVHYASDVIAGWVLGFIIAMVLFLIFNTANERV